MTIPLRLFIDACVLVSAANSPDGGSARLLQIAEEGAIRLVATRLVLHEAKTNIIDLLGRPVWPWFHRIISPLRLSLADPSTSKEKAEWAKITSIKDAHVLAGAIKGKADFLITLDKKHILKPPVQAAFPIPILSPGDFLQQNGFAKPSSQAHPKSPVKR